MATVSSVPLTQVTMVSEHTTTIDIGGIAIQHTTLVVAHPEADQRQPNVKPQCSRRFTPNDAFYT
jgi:hypothetical protein